MDSKGNNSLRECSKCNKVAAPEGGIEMGQQRWYCSACWLKFINRR